MKGTMSELELSLFRQRSHEALKQKARRGALFLRLAAGYVKAGRDRIEKDPDHRVQDALKLVFSKFAEFQSARQVHVWLPDEGLVLPVKSRNTEERGIIWRLPAYNTVHNILTNPIHAGAYAFGRTTSKVSVENGRKRVRRGLRRPQTEWDVLLKDQHAGYITWEQFERNQRVIADNATGKGSATVKGAVRRGELLLAGLLRCGHCGRKLHVAYSGKIGAITATEPARTTAQSDASRSVDWAPTRQSTQRFCASCGRSASMPRSRRSRLRRPRRQPRKDSSSWRCSGRGTRPPMPVDNTMPSIPPIVWWPVSLSGAGTRRCRPCIALKARSPQSWRGSQRRWASESVSS